MPLSQLSIAKHFATVKDPRRKHGRKHRLLDILVISLCAVLCGANSWQQVVTFGRKRRAWLQRFLALPSGLPAHDTFERVFDRLDPQALQRCLRGWLRALAKELGVEHIAIDGKTVRGSAGRGLGPLHLVSAWSTEYHLSLGQVAVDAKSNEITAIPALLDLLDVKGALVTIDAMGCQRDIAAKVVQGGGDYLLVVKDNQEFLRQDIEACVAQVLENDGAGLASDEHRSEGWEHGRHEVRTCLAVYEPTGLRNQEAWPGLKAIGLCARERVVNGKTSQELCYFITSKRLPAWRYARLLRGHWKIENCLHWSLDVTFAEDDSRIIKRHEAENFALLRRLALSLLKRHPGPGSLACKRLEAALDPNYLEEILGAQPKLEKP